MVLGSFFVCHSTHVIEAPCECYNIWSFDEFFFCCPCTWSQFLCKRRAKVIKLIVFMAHNWSQKVIINILNQQVHLLKWWNFSYSLAELFYIKTVLTMLNGIWLPHPPFFHNHFYIIINQCLTSGWMDLKTGRSIKVIWLCQNKTQEIMSGTLDIK